jgi:hypothetical protein
MKLLDQCAFLEAMLSVAGRCACGPAGPQGVICFLRAIDHWGKSVLVWGRECAQVRNRLPAGRFYGWLRQFCPRLADDYEGVLDVIEFYEEQSEEMGFPI